MTAPWRTISYPRLLLIALALVIGATLVIGSASSTTVFGAYNPAWDGVSELREMADAEGAERVILQDTDRYSTLTERDAIAFILAPDSNYTQREARRIEQFLQRGGTVVVAGDFGPVPNSLLNQTGAEARLEGGLLRDERFNNASPELPIATHVANHTYTEGVENITLNRGTAVIPSGAEVLIRTSSYAYIDQNRNGALDDSEVLRQRPVMTVESIGQGEVVVLGDPSLFINVMIDRGGNRALAENLISTHESVVFDLSHVSAVPPLIGAQLALQRTPLLQLIVGFSLVFLVIYWQRIRSVLKRLQNEIGSDTPPERAPNPEIVRQQVQEKFPDWDDDRVQRVTQEIIQRRQQGEGNE